MVMLNLPSVRPQPAGEVPGWMLVTPWKANRAEPPKTNRSPDASSTSWYGRPRSRVLPNRNVHESPTDSDTTGASSRVAGGSRESRPAQAHHPPGKRQDPPAVVVGGLARVLVRLPVPAQAHRAYRLLVPADLSGAGRHRAPRPLTN